MKPQLERPHSRHTKLQRRSQAANVRHRAKLGVELLESRELLTAGANLGSISGLTDTPAERFTTQLYYDLLQRVPSAAEVAGWVRAMNAGVAPAAIPSAFISSAEYQSNLINDDYYSILQRQPSAAELQAWLGLAQAGTSAEQLKADFLGSSEFYQKEGSTAAGWLNGVYQDVLGRAVDPQGLAVWSGLLQAGVSRTDVARAIVTSREAHGLLVAAVYQQLLNRNPSSAEVSAWVTTLGQGVSQERFVAAVAGSGEYYQLAVPPAATRAGTPTFSSAHFDLNAKNSPTAPGYIGVPMTAYGAGLGYGWVSVTGLSYRNRTYTDPLRRDFQNGSNGTFEVNMVNGYYAVTTTLGDASAPHTGMAIYLNGTLEVSGLNTAAGQWINPTFGVQVTNGLLSVRIRATGPNPTFAVDGFDIVPDAPITASAGPAQSANEGSPVSFSGSASGGTGSLTYIWNFGDGRTASGTLDPTHTYAASGTYTARLTVTDSLGLAQTASTTVTINNLPPANLSLTQSATSINEGSSLNLGGSFTDAGAADTHQVVINWGDGSANTTVNLATGVLSFSGVSHQYQDNPTGQPAGSYSISVSVTDNAGGSTSTGTSVQVNAVAPTVNAGGPYSGTAGSAITFSASASDPSPLDTAFTYTWNFGDGNTGSGAAPSHTYSAAGTYTVTVTAADDDGSGTATASVTVSPPGQSVASLQVSGFPSPVTAGTAGSFTVTALDSSGHVDTGYTGTVHFTSSDPQATLPADYTFTGNDQGVHTFSATLKTAGTQSLTATDSVTTAINGGQTGITVAPGAATQLSVSAPSGATAGQAFSITVTGQDAYGNTATGYTGTVHFTSSDSQATLPADYTFTSGDQGVHTFSVTLVTAGSQTITATDTGTGSITGTATLTVTPTGPVTSWHYTPNSNFVNGVYVPGAYGFNLADVSSVSDLSMLPAGDKALVYLGMGDGVTTAFINAVTPFIGDSRVFAFYLVDEPDPTGRWHPLVLASNLKAESDWIHTNDPGAKTFIVLMNMGDDTNPTYMNTYNSANTDIDYFGLDPYPVQTQFGGANYNIITAAVAAAEAWGITQSQIIPVYQAFGGGGYSSWILPTASQAQQILATWASVVPNPAFDYTYSWGIQNNDSALVNSPDLLSVYAAHNA
jgi:PKD repeat protein